ncbi:transcriptional protein SWT1-like, partial [Solenopsis invicta]|uniref:transcriptional protein SWT1-like n=1 Tax=Solenopsis invicta TaxID=13686 RepID=UPI00193E5EF8
QGKMFKKNLAKERIEKLRKNLSIDKKKFKEMSQANLVNKKVPQKSNRLPVSSSLGSTCVYKNADVRLKKLHNRIIKDVIYEKNITLNNDKSQSQPSNEPVIEIMTDDKLIEKAKQEVLYEEMDWEPMKDEEIALEVEVVRTQIDRENYMAKTNCISENIAELTQLNEMKSHEKGPLYIVVDTNVFLSNLEIIEEAKDATFKNYPRPFIVIPWTVICELDYFKNNKSKYELSIKARKAISFIHNQFSSKHPRVIGQTRDQAKKNKEDFSIDCPDDEILQCCLQIHQLQISVILLSYDKNLCTKAMIYNIRALGRNDPLENIDDLNTNSYRVINRLNEVSVENSVFNEELHFSDDFFENIKLILTNFLSTIITKQMSEIYGETEWKIYVVIKPPWTAVTALKCAVKHWIAAINESFQRCAERILKELLDAFVHVPVGGRKLRDVEYILEKSSDLVQAVNMDKHYDLMTETFNAITELKQKCTKCITNIDKKKLHEKIGIAKNIQEQEMRAEKVFQCFHQIYDYARNICGLACNSAGMAYSFTFKSVNLPMSPTYLQGLKSEITRKVTDLTQNLNKLLMQDDNSIKHQMLLNLQQNLNTFLLDSERVTFDVTALDVYYCVKLKEESLKTGLRQLQELTSHFSALATHT